jgi:hypothetical protein
MSRTFLCLPLALACTGKEPAGSDSGPADTGSSSPIDVLPLVEGFSGMGDAAPSPDGATMYFSLDSGEHAGLWALGEDAPAAPPSSHSEDAAQLLGGEGIAAVAVGAGAIYAGYSSGAEGYPVLALSREGAPLDPIGAGALASVGALLALPGAEVAFVAGGQDESGRSLVESCSGGTCSPLATWEGPPPSGLVLAGDGTLYAAAGDQVLLLGEEGATTIAEGVQLGEPAGIALTPDETTLMVSSVSDEGRSQVLLIDRQSLAQSTFDEVIGENRGSGGLHRAHDKATVYGWCGYTSEGTTTIYRVQFN